jgi:hypothetical protein
MVFLSWQVNVCTCTGRDAKMGQDPGWANWG